MKRHMNQKYSTLSRDRKISNNNSLKKSGQIYQNISIYQKENASNERSTIKPINASQISDGKTITSLDLV